MPQQACRACVRALADRQQFDNPGLALQRYLLGRRTKEEERENTPDPVRTLLERVQASPASDVYKAAFARYRAALPNPVQIELTLGGPLALGLGMCSPLEVGLTTLHTYGMPVIPGSAIKGVCRDTAEDLVKAGQVTCEQFEALIGDQTNAGLCVFYDAWYIPEGDCKPFHRDVVTVHHPNYYQGGGAWPTDFDDPNPVPFVVVKPGARFLFAVKPPSPDWADFVQKLLIHAMTKHGVGGKINAGYGWFKDPGGAGTQAAHSASASTSQAGTTDDTQTSVAGPAQAPADEAVWEQVTLSYAANTGEVSCATAYGKATAKLSDLGLPEDAVSKIKKRKTLENVTVRVSPVGGRNYAIVEVIGT